jgi:hypothetical protein
MLFSNALSPANAFSSRRSAAAAGGPINAKTKAALAWVQDVLDLKDKFDLLHQRRVSFEYMRSAGGERCPHDSHR